MIVVKVFTCMIESLTKIHVQEKEIPNNEGFNSLICVAIVKSNGFVTKD